MQRIRETLLLLIALLSIGGAGLALGGCETTKGLGEDIQNASEATEEEINEDD